MKIAFICCEYPPGPHGGIGTFTRMLGRALAARGHTIRVIGIYPPSHPVARESADGPIQVVRIPCRGRRGAWLLSRWQLYRTLARWSRQGELDLIEMPDSEGWAAGWPALPVPVLTRLHGSLSYFAAEDGRHATKLLFHLERASLRRSDFCCSVSRYTAERTSRLFGVPAADCTVLYNGVELPVVTTPERDAMRVVFTGTLALKKGVLSLVRAWPEVLRRYPEAELHVLGKDGRAPEGGSMQQFLRSQLDEASAARVRFHGHASRDEVLAMLQSARVAVFPSYAEAFALAPMEAMACGCPTIYTRRGSGPELIEDGHDGLLVDPDRPAEIAAAIVRVLDDAALARRLADQGRQRIASAFSIEDATTRNEAFYRQCIDRFQPTRRRRRKACAAIG